jgi:hypothetical protein
MKTILVSVLALGLATTGVMAQGTVPDLMTADADKSGDVSFAEAQLIWPDLTADAFTTADADGSGALSQAEFDAHVATLPKAQ